MDSKSRSGRWRTHIAVLSSPNPTRLVSSSLMQTSSHLFNTCIPRPLCLGHCPFLCRPKFGKQLSNSYPLILHFCVLKDALSTNHGSTSLPLHRQCFSMCELVWIVAPLVRSEGFLVYSSSFCPHRWLSLGHTRPSVEVEGGTRKTRGVPDADQEVAGSSI